MGSESVLMVKKCCLNFVNEYEPVKPRCSAGHIGRIVTGGMIPGGQRQKPKITWAPVPEDYRLGFSRITGDCPTPHNDDKLNAQH